MVFQVGLKEGKEFTKGRVEKRCLRTGENACVKMGVQAMSEGWLGMKLENKLQQTFEQL